MCGLTLRQARYFTGDICRDRQRLAYGYRCRRFFEQLCAESHQVHQSVEGLFDVDIDTPEMGLRRGGCDFAHQQRVFMLDADGGARRDLF